MKRAVVTFIDILGFKNLVESIEENELSDILSLFHKYNTESPFNKKLACNFELNDIFDIKTIIFSDSIVRIRYAPDYLEKDSLFDSGYMCMLESELRILAGIQSSLLKKRILIRGGITIGDIFYNEKTNQLFGKAMNRAYEIESKIAKYPRIVIDPTFSNTYSTSMNFIESPIFIDSEMLFSVDFFNEREAKLLLWDLKRLPNKRKEVMAKIKNGLISQKKLLEDCRTTLIEMLLRSTASMRINPNDQPAENLFKAQDINIFGKHAWIVARFNSSIDNWNKVRDKAEYRDFNVNKIFLNRCVWTDSTFPLNERAFDKRFEVDELDEL